MSSSNSKETLERIHAALEAARDSPEPVHSRRYRSRIQSRDMTPSPKPITLSTTSCARRCFAPAKAGSRKRQWTTSRDSTRRRVWVVDPLDGTREFVQGIPEFCVSIAMVENERSGRRWNLQSRDQRTHSRLARHRRNLQRQARATQPAQGSARRARACQPQRGQARRVEAV